MKQAMTPEEIKEKKPYLDWSLSEKEYELHQRKAAATVCQTTRKRAFTRQCGPSTVPTKSPSQCCDCSPTRMTEFCKGLVKVLVSLTLMTVRQSFSRPKVTTTHQRLSHTKARLLVSAGFYATSQYGCAANRFLRLAALWRIKRCRDTDESRWRCARDWRLWQLHGDSNRRW